MRLWWLNTPEGRVQLGIICAHLALIGVAAFVSFVSIPPSNWPAFILALSGFYLGVLNPLLRRPRLRIRSTSHHSASLHQSKPSRLQLQIANYGQTSARNCVGRLIEVRTGDGQPIATFAPQTLCWARQRDTRDSRPITIHGYGDCAYLDVAVYEHDHFRFRYADITELPSGDAGAEEDVPWLVPVVAFIRIGIYAEGVRNPPLWFKLSAEGVLIQADPPHGAAPIGNGRATEPPVGN